MLPQVQMIHTVRKLCEQDESLLGAVMYGSFTRGEGDEFSDIEFYLFFDDSRYDSVDLNEWISRIARVEVCFQNEFGTTVAIFDNLVRGEFHASPASAMSQIQHWASNVWVRDPQSMIILDRTGKLHEHVSSLVGPRPGRTDAKEISLLWHRFLDWMVFGTSVLRRGELARALELLWFVDRHLLWMVRILEGRTEHYPTPSKGLETDISPPAYDRYKRCTAVLDLQSLRDAYSACWVWGKELIQNIAQSQEVELPRGLAAKLDKRFSDWLASP